MSAKEHRRAAQAGGRYRGYANGGSVGPNGTAGRVTNGTRIKASENPSSAQLEGRLKSNRGYVDAGMSGAQRGNIRKS